MKYFHYFIIYFFITVGKNDNRERIIGGMNAKKDVWKFMVAVIKKQVGTDVVDVCGGSILDACYILTAAHCV